MGRRKTRKVIKREPKRLPKVFRCPRCGEQSVVVELDRQVNNGRVRCGRCQLSADLPIHNLTQTIDVYAIFLDKYYGGSIEETPREREGEKTPESSRAQSTAEHTTTAASPSVAVPKPTEGADTSQETSPPPTEDKSKTSQPAEPSQQRTT